MPVYTLHCGHPVYTPYIVDTLYIHPTLWTPCVYTLHLSQLNIHHH